MKTYLKRQIVYRFQQRHINDWNVSVVMSHFFQRITKLKHNQLFHFVQALIYDGTNCNETNKKTSASKQQISFAKKKRKYNARDE